MKRLRRFARDLRFHLVRTWCVLFGHRSLTYIGDLTRKGFRPIACYQCPRCTEVVVKMTDAVRALGKKGEVR